MTERKFAQLLSTIDPALIAEAEASVPLRQKPRFRIALVAAALALVICAALLVVSFIPTTLELDYPANGDMDFENVWIYYTDKGGHQKSEYVRLPYSVQNVFVAWAHLSGLDESAQLYEIISTEGADSDRQVIVTLSSALRDHPDSEQLLASLKKTLVRDFGVLGENFTFYFSDIGVWELHYEVRPNTYSFMQGSQIEIAVGATNVSLLPITVSGSEYNYFPYAVLCAGGGDNQIVISPEVLQVPDEPSEHVFAPGESREITYTFEIPADAPTGSYDLILSFGESSMTFEGAVEVVVFSEPAIGTLEFYHAPSGISTTLGSTVSISVGMLNISDVPLYFTGSRSEFVPDAVLHMDDIVIHHDDRELTGEYATHMCRVGEAIEVTHIFQIPNDIPAGAYDLTISFAGQSLTLKEAVIILCREEIDTPFDPDTLFDYEMQYKPTYEDYLQIREGMTVEEVVAILGKPHGLDAAVGSKYLCWTTADGASCAIKVTSPNATEGWTDWADILQPHYGGATVVHHNYYGSVSDEDG